MKGETGPLHSHPHEQVTYVVRGRALFRTAGREIEVPAGESIYFAPDQPHELLALEDTVLTDFFTPRREDLV